MHVRVRRPLFVARACLALLLLASAAAAQEQQPQQSAPLGIRYTLSMPAPETHLFEVRVDVSGLGGAGHVDFQMPRWSPGRYAIFDFAKNVQEFAVTGLTPAPNVRCAAPGTLGPLRLDTQTWRVQTCGSPQVAVTYKVFADDLSGTFSQLDARHASFNGHSVFVYVAGHKPDPVSLKVVAPRGWKVVNGYTTRDDQTEFSFPNYDVLADTPTDVAPEWAEETFKVTDLPPNLTIDTFKVEGKTYRVVIHSFGPDGGKRPALVRGLERVVREQVRMMGGAPDFEQYTFLYHFDPLARGGDGMEHLNSTQIVIPRALAEEGVEEGALEVGAHEFFHVWNVKRLRPAGLGPWEFTHPVVTRGLWIAEGFTNYYETLSLRRASLRTDEQLMRAYAGTIAGIENSPGSRLMSAEESSLLASFIDRGSSEQRTNLQNTAVSYYPKGETLGLVLDLLIRKRSGGRASLDDVMRRAYEEFYLKAPKDSYYLRGRAYTPEEFERLTTEVAGADMSDFFARHVRRPERPPYEEALAAVGLKLLRAPAPLPHTAGIQLDSRDEQHPRIAGLRTGSAGQRAGLRAGDVLLRVGARDVTRDNWLEALNAHKTGDRVPFAVRRAGATVTVQVTLAEPDNFRYRIEKDENATPEARRMREAWLTGKK